MSLTNFANRHCSMTAKNRKITRALTRQNNIALLVQPAKKIVSDSSGLVDFAIGLVNSVFNLPDGQVMFFEEFE